MAISSSGTSMIVFSPLCRISQLWAPKLIVRAPSAMVCGSASLRMILPALSERAASFPSSGSAPTTWIFFPDSEIPLITPEA